MKLETGVRDPKEMQSRKLYEGSGVQGERNQEIKVFEKVMDKETWGEPCEDFNILGNKMNIF